MKRRQILVFALAAMLLCGSLMLCASAADTVVYLATGAKGDGSSPSDPVGTLTLAYDALDLEKDCTVVLVGEFKQSAQFTYTKEYTGSVTITSVYDGVDYRRTAGAAWSSNASRFICTGDVTFRDVDFYLSGAYYYVVGNCHKVTIDTGVTMQSSDSNFTGAAVDKGFTIAGGYQNKQILYAGSEEMPPVSSDAPTNVTVRSGSKLVLLAYSRQIQDANYNGDATLTVEGDAEVGTIYLSPVNYDYSGTGNVVLNIGGNAQIENVYGGTNNGTVGSITVNWTSGEINFFARSNRSTNATEATNGYTLNVSGAAEDATFLNKIAKVFDTVHHGDTTAPAKTEVKLTIGEAVGIVNGEAKALDAAPIIRNSRTMLPVRFLAEAFGAEVKWDGETSTAKITAEGVSIAITIGAATAKINGADVTLDSPAFIENSRTYLPVRVIADALGAAVDWDGATSTAILTK